VARRCARSVGDLPLVLRAALPISEPAERTIARFAGWSFDTGRHALTAPDGREIALSAAEAGLLATMLRRPNKILSREQLLGERRSEEHTSELQSRENLACRLLPET